MTQNVFHPNWTLPDNVGVAITTRAFGNLAVHVGDDPAAVLLRRRRLERELSLPHSAVWLQQQHTSNVLSWPFKTSIADAAYSSQPGSVCAVLTADCLPILICSSDGKEIAAIHAGWRGLADGVLQKALEKFSADPSSLSVWIGPAISSDAFEVGQDVFDAFVSINSDAKPFFKATGAKWLADLPGIAEMICRQFGITAITQSYECTVTHSELWYSWRKEKAAARFASIIWRK
ncbi:peptidoglycan editing factor PgeF [Idiomarina sp. UBA4520]|uniref:peptidoglycan editing factor PgeF n=1 Tax=Idiomarina sp. UBA4520 TaxID=1946647 RepID=UPI00257DF5A6|nr:MULTISPECIES: peptidoglycan editing factor PgeF [unclassified Idiomarina]